MIVLGIDPGAEGGWAVIDSAGFYTAHPLPLIDWCVDLGGILRDIDVLLSPPDLVVVEHQQAQPKDGSASMNYLLRQFGQLVGWCQAAKLALLTPKPQEWKKHVLKGTARDKAAACLYVAKRYPSANLRPGRRRKDADGIADSLCIAEWGLLHSRSAYSSSSSEAPAAVTPALSKP